MAGSNVGGGIAGEPVDDRPVNPTCYIPLFPGEVCLKVNFTPDGEVVPQLFYNTMGVRDATKEETDQLMAGVAYLLDKQPRRIIDLGREHFHEVFDRAYSNPYYSKGTDMRSTVCVGSA